MALLDAILGQAGSGTDLAGLAGRFGLDPVMAQKAVAALGQSHEQPGDTAALAADKTGLDTGTMQQMIAAIGGEGALGQIAQQITANPQVMQMLDRDGDGSVIDDIAGIASGFFARK